MSESRQSFENHAKIVPGYHRWAAALVALPTLYFAYRAAFDFSVDRLVLFLFGVGVLLTATYTRVFPVGVQDRVIRLEERLRLERVLPADLRSRIPELTTRQLVSLRFASDEELPDLVRRVLGGELSGRHDIKRAVRNWRADEQRI
ncbi:MAG: DUF6526 family protein [Gemmatimonadales bacterium]